MACMLSDECSRSGALKKNHLRVKVIDIYTHKVYIPTCCAPLTLGHKKKFDTVSCGHNFKLKRSSNNLWQLKKVVRVQRVDQRVDRRAAQRAARRVRRARRVLKAQRVRRVRRVQRARKAQRAASSPIGQRTSTFHRRTQHTWPLEAILKGTANASTKRAVPFSCAAHHIFFMLASVRIPKQVEIRNVNANPKEASAR